MTSLYLLEFYCHNSNVSQPKTNRLKTIKGFIPSQYKKIKTRIAHGLIRPKNFLVKIKKIIIYSKVYKRFEGMDETNKSWVLTIVYLILFIVIICLPIPISKKYLKKQVRKSHKKFFCKHIMEYIPIDRAKRNQGRVLLLTANLTTLGLGMLYDRFCDDSFIVNRLLQGTSAGLSSFIILNYQLLGDLVPETLRENIEPIIIKLATPWVSLSTSVGMAAPFWFQAFDKICILEDAQEVLMEGQKNLFRKFGPLKTRRTS